MVLDGPSFEAARNGDIVTLRRLAEEDPAWLAEVRGQWTLLHVAAGNGYLDVIKFLFKTAPPPGCSLEARNKLGATPLHVAAMYGQTRAIELLVSRGAEVNAQDLRGRTPLYYAMHNDELEAVRRLLSLKADPTVMDEDGCTARTVAGLQLHKPHMVEISEALKAAEGQWQGKGGKKVMLMMAPAPSDGPASGAGGSQGGGGGAALPPRGKLLKRGVSAKELMEDALDGITAAVPRGPVSLAINTSVAHTSGSSAVSSPKPYINNR